MNHNSLIPIFFYLGSSLLLEQLQKMGLSEDAKIKQLSKQIHPVPSIYLTLHSVITPNVCSGEIACTLCRQ